jgi:hypothetical protein
MIRRFTKEDDQKVIDEKDIHALMLHREHERGRDDVILKVDEFFNQNNTMEVYEWEKIKHLVRKDSERKFDLIIEKD